MYRGVQTNLQVMLTAISATLIAVSVLVGCASSASTVSDETATEDEAETAAEEPAADAAPDDVDDDEPGSSGDGDEATADSDDNDDKDDDGAGSRADAWSAAAADDDADTAPEPPNAGADRTTQYAHVEDFDLEFKNARIDVASAELLFDDLGDGDDIPESFDNLLESADHDFRFDDIAPIVEAELPAELGDSLDIFVLLSSKYGLIGCEAYLRGQDGQDWNDNLFGYLLEQAIDLPADQRNNQAGLLVIGSNVVGSQLCPRLQSHT